MEILGSGSTIRFVPGKNTQRTSNRHYIEMVLLSPNSTIARSPAAQLYEEQGGLRIGFECFHKKGVRLIDCAIRLGVEVKV
jgi:hypothetical protein